MSSNNNGNGKNKGESLKGVVLGALITLAGVAAGAGIALYSASHKSTQTQTIIQKTTIVKPGPTTTITKYNTSTTSSTTSSSTTTTTYTSSSSTSTSTTKSTSSNTTTTAPSPIKQINQSELYVFGTNSTLVPLKVINVTKAGNDAIIYAKDLYNGKTLKIEGNYNFTTFFNPVTGQFQSIFSNSSLEKLIYMAMYIPTTKNITNSCIFYQGNSTIQLGPNASVFYVVGSQQNVMKFLSYALNKTVPEVFTTGYSVYGLPYGLWGFQYINQTGKSVVLNFNSQSLQNAALNSVKTAGYFLGNTSILNPGQYGVYPITSPLGYSVTTYSNNYTQYDIYKSINQVVIAPAQGDGPGVVQYILGQSNQLPHYQASHKSINSDKSASSLGNIGKYIDKSVIGGTIAGALGYLVMRNNSIDSERSKKYRRGPLTE
ncbi:hypothetical protein YN1_4020 [Nanoarchaeota archaeon]